LAGDDLAAFVHQHRGDEAELEDAGRDLRHLLGGMRARISGIGQQGCDRARLDGARRPWGLGHLHLRDRGMVAGAAGNCAALATWKTGLALGTLRASAPRIQRGQEGPCGSRATVADQVTSASGAAVSDAPSRRDTTIANSICAQPRGEL
jgi:hypothetical protein